MKYITAVTTIDGYKVSHKDQYPINAIYEDGTILIKEKFSTIKARLN